MSTNEEKAPQKGFVVFVGRYEVHYDLEEAENRLEELLDAGHDLPTMMKVELTEYGENGPEPMALTVHKIIDTAKASEIR